MAAPTLQDRIYMLMEHGDFDPVLVAAVLGLDPADVEGVLADPNASVSDPDSDASLSSAISALQSARSTDEATLAGLVDSRTTDEATLASLADAVTALQAAPAGGNVNYRGDWAVGPDYALRDLVVDADGGVYICTTANTGTAVSLGDEPGNGGSASLTDWVSGNGNDGGDVGIAARFEGTWSSLTAYLRGDVVKGSDENTYICVAPSTNNDPTTDDHSHWQAWGNDWSRFSGAWDSSTPYTAGEAVTDAGVPYVCVASTTNNQPSTDDGSHWVGFPAGVTYRDAWAPDTDYAVNDLVSAVDSGFPTLAICMTAHRSVATVPENDPQNNHADSGALWRKLGSGADIPRGH